MPCGSSRWSRLAYGAPGGVHVTLLAATKSEISWLLRGYASKCPSPLLLRCHLEKDPTSTIEREGPGCVQLFGTPVMPNIKSSQLSTLRWLVEGMYQLQRQRYVVE